MSRLRCLLYILIYFYPLTILANVSYPKIEDLPKVLPLTKEIGDIESIIKFYNLQMIDLVSGNKLYTNLHDKNFFAKEINKIILAQDVLFSKKSPPYNIVIIDHPKFNNNNGCAENNNILVYLNSKGNIKDCLRVISHELIHRYVGHMLNISQKVGSTLEYKWFFEGFAEFYGTKTLLDTKILNQKEYLQVVNEALKQYFDSSMKTIDFKKLIQKDLQDPGISIITYYKGLILALILDEKIKEFSNNKYNLQTIINSLLEEMLSKQRNFSTKLFSDCLSRYLPKSYITKFIASIENPNLLIRMLPTKLLGQNLVLQNTENYSDICFDLVKTRESKKIRGVKSGSKCYELGMRNGQPIKCFSMYTDSGKIVLKLLEKNKSLKIIEYNAEKKIAIIPLYQ